MRIATHRSTNTTPAAALEKNTQRAGGSFFEALSQASGLLAASSKSAAPATPNTASPRNSEAAQVATPESERTPAAQIPTQDAQAVAVSTDPKNGAKQGPAQATAPSSTTSSAQGTTNEEDRQHLSSTTLAAKIAAAVVVPALPLIASAVVTAAAPLPQLVSDGNPAGIHHESNTNSSAIAAAPAEDLGALPTHGGAKIDGNSQPTALHPADARTGAESDSVAASQDAPSSGPAVSSSGTAMAQNLSIATSPLVDLLFPPMGIPSNIEGKAETANNTQAIKVPDQSGARTSDSQSADGSAKSFASQPASSDSSVAGAGNANQAGQHAQTNTSQPAVEPSKPVDSGAMPAQSLAAQSAPRESAAHAQADAPADATRPSGQSLPLQTGDDASTAAINTARLIQSMSQTEMRVGMHSAEFGEISIRTAVSQQQMTAQISVDSSDLGKAISAHIPAMQEKLGGETGLRALVEVSQGSMSFSGEQGSSSPRQQSSYAAPARIAATVAPVEADYPVSQATTWAVSNGYRLDIRA